MGDSTSNIKLARTKGVIEAVLGPEKAREIFTGFGIDARSYLDKDVPNTTQCEKGGAGKVTYYNPESEGSLQTCTKCYICGLPILSQKSTGMAPECEHVVPVIVAVIYLKLYSKKGDFSDMTSLVYKWAHETCNQEKSDDWPLYIERVAGPGQSLWASRRAASPPRRRSRSRNRRPPRSRSRSRNRRPPRSQGGGARDPVRVIKGPEAIEMAKKFTFTRKAPGLFGKIGLRLGDKKRAGLKRLKGLTKKHFRKRELESIDDIPFVDGAYNLGAELNGDIPRLSNTYGVYGDVMKVRIKDIEDMLGKIWDSRRNNATYFKRQLVTVFGTKDNFIRKRRNHLFNVYQVIADYINKVQRIDGGSVANLLTLAGLASIEPKAHRPDIESELERRGATVEAVNEEADAALRMVAESLVGLSRMPVAPATPATPAAPFAFASPPMAPATPFAFASPPATPFTSALSRSGSLDSISATAAAAPILAGLYSRPIRSNSLASISNSVAPYISALSRLPKGPYTGPMSPGAMSPIPESQGTSGTRELSNNNTL
jgi:hypothetical protein